MKHWLLFIAAAKLVFGGEACPYINAATVAGVVGGPVQSETKCSFQHADTKLTITVEPTADFARYLAKCGTAAEHLRGIGNEAVSCSGDDKSAKLSEQVIGRVRDQVFVIRISSSDPAAIRPTLREQARTIAEHVAGALF